MDLRRKTTYGGTIKKRIPKGAGVVTCPRCLDVMKKNYYKHQCDMLYSYTCFKCLEDRGRCKRCGFPYRVEIRSEPFTFGL